MASWLSARSSRIAALSEPEPGARFACQFPHGGTRKAFVGGAYEHSFDPRGVGPHLIPKCREARNAFAKGGFGWVERTGFNGIAGALEAGFGFGGAPVR
jgi:hypothetical protein